MKKLYQLLFFSVLLGAIISCEKTESVNPERELAIQDYMENYLGSAVSDPLWTGDVTTCDAGSVPESTHEKVIQRINYFRRLVGLNDDTVLDPTQFDRYQEAALMQSANFTLDHFPPMSWLCYTDEGSIGSGSSNLASAHSTNAITLFMQDHGSGNERVGHRRWILHSSKTAFSYGTTNTRMSLRVFDGNGNTQELPPFIAYPPNGYIPYQLSYSRWSFGIPGADFSGATITMTGPDGNIDAPVISRENGPGDNTIVWEPQGITSGAIEESFTVLVSDIGNAPLTSYTYDVHIFDSNL